MTFYPDITIAAINAKALPWVLTWLAMWWTGPYRFMVDMPLPAFYAGARSLRIADGPYIVHMKTVAKEELKQLQSKL